MGHLVWTLGTSHASSAFWGSGAPRSPHCPIYVVTSGAPATDAFHLGVCSAVGEEGGIRCDLGEHHREVEEPRATAEQHSEEQT